MKIVFTSTGTDWDAKIDPRFGRADYLLLFDEETEQLSTIDNRSIREVAHGAGPKTAQKIFELGADILITGNGPGDHAARALEHSQIRIFINAHNLTLGEAFTSFKEGKLTEL